MSHDDRPLPAGLTTAGYAGLRPFLRRVPAVALSTLGLRSLG